MSKLRVGQLVVGLLVLVAALTGVGLRIAGRDTPGFPWSSIALGILGAGQLAQALAKDTAPRPIHAFVSLLAMSTAVMWIVSVLLDR